MPQISSVLTKFTCLVLNPRLNQLSVYQDVLPPASFQALTSMSYLRGPFQPLTFCDSVKTATGWSLAQNVMTEKVVHEMEMSSSLMVYGVSNRSLLIPKEF